MKRLVTIAALAGLFLLPGRAHSGITGTPHDIATGDQTCQVCHSPHNAAGQKLWFQAVGSAYGDLRDLCISCHDGTTNEVGWTTAMDGTKQQHIGVIREVDNPGGTPDCDGCHDVHNSPNGKFLYPEILPTANEGYCGSCHTGSAPPDYALADDHGNHVYGAANTTNHYMSSTFQCVQCHTPHGAADQLGSGGNMTGLTNPILLANNWAGGTSYGAFCGSCHEGTAPDSAVSGSGGLAAADTAVYYEGTADGTELKHPTWSANVTARGGCGMCHDVHQPVTTTTNVPHLLTTDNKNGAFCISCHDGTLNARAFDSTGYTHPYNVTPANLGMAALASSPLPWSDLINDDPTDTRFPGADYPGATPDEITCESCHSVHRQGKGGKFLRIVNSENQLCGGCHPNNY